jgi:two-component system nitrogen regulation response regulator GlnG
MTECAEEALAHARCRPGFAVILAELKLPGQSGLGLLSRVRQSCPDTAVILLTGQPDVSSSVCAFSLGVTEYVTKPVAAARLVALCQAAVARAAQPRHSRRSRTQLEAQRDGL